MHTIVKLQGDSQNNFTVHFSCRNNRIVAGHLWMLCTQEIGCLCKMLWMSLYSSKACPCLSHPYWPFWHTRIQDNWGTWNRSPPSLQGKYRNKRRVCYSSYSCLCEVIPWDPTEAQKKIQGKQEKTDAQRCAFSGAKSHHQSQNHKQKETSYLQTVSAAAIRIWLIANFWSRSRSVRTGEHTVSIFGIF